MTESELAAIEARCAAATPGPWFITIPKASHFRIATTAIKIKGGFGRVVAVGPCNNYSKALPKNVVRSQNNGMFIAHARTDLPRLLAAYREAREKAAAFDALQNKQTP